MAAPAFPPFRPRFATAATLLGMLGLAGCQTGGYQDSVPPTSGVQPLKGLAQNVSVRRNAMGAPLIESSSFHDALFSLGYVHAGDRIEQMVAMRLLAGSATPTSAACRVATACSCPAPGTTPNAPNAWHSWPAMAATTAAA